MVKKFKIIQNLERKYNGENLPIRVRQDDVGTIIESQIFTEENNPYDLTDCNVTFNMQATSGIPNLGEKAEIIDAVNGKISYSLSAKDTKIPGRPKSAYFTISYKNGEIIESTGDINLIILPIPKITDDDYIKAVSNFKDKIRGDLNSNPNFILRTSFVGYGNYPDDFVFGEDHPDDHTTPLKNYEISQLFYRDYSKTPLFVSPYNDNASAVHIFCFKCNPNTRKIVINNFNFAPIKAWDSNLSLVHPNGKLVFIANGENINIQNMLNQHFPRIPKNKAYVAPISNTINNAGFEILKKDVNQQVTDFSIDLTKVNPLTEDGYLMLMAGRGLNNNHEFSDDYFPRTDRDGRYWHSKTDSEPPITGEATSIQNFSLTPIPLNMTCTQYYLPD